ncbi:hypothetical protein [Bradyrhizobium sp. SBR1B]|uniref:hypothetical protein n=1 Tax=Bradyrhizobium sp. SBR1B TaxID=2663836 RepID=UPI00184AA73E|nr:hypothetical protein [Bradyrhizobium sp. SBR1B]MBB4380330.1 hypothetical protein [Bradyrhizobium sp. SBR1B]
MMPASTNHAEAINDVDCSIPLGDHLLIRARALSATPTSSDDASATRRARRSKAPCWTPEGGNSVPICTEMCRCNPPEIITSSLARFGSGHERTEMRRRRRILDWSLPTGRTQALWHWHTVHVMAAARIPVFERHFDADLYDELVRPGERMGEDEIVEYHLQALYAKEVEFVIAGCETGVELADTLSERLGLPTNGTALSAAKARLSCALTYAGVRSIRQVVSDTAAEIVSWKLTRSSMRS